MTLVDNLDAIRYPIGRVTIATEVTAADRRAWIAQIAATPAGLRAALEGLSESQLDRCYREGGWTLRQVAHHLADEHMNAFGYFKKAATEDDPLVNVYDEPRWAETKDAREAPIELSLELLTALHARWVILLESLSQKISLAPINMRVAGGFRLTRAFSFTHGMAVIIRLISPDYETVKGGSSLIPNVFGTGGV